MNERMEEELGPTVLVVEADPAAVRAALSRSGFAVREAAIGSLSRSSGTVMAVTTGETLDLGGGERESSPEQGLSAAAILARAGLSADGPRPYPPRPLPTGW
jgi:hypothetical protein